MSNSSQIPSPHVALLPSAGMGHLIPFLRLAAALSRQNFQLTLITIHPTVSSSESQYISRFLSAFPHISSMDFHLLPFDPSTAKSNDPFFLQMEAIRRSAPALSPLLSSLSPPLSALITDIFLTSSFIPITSDLHLPNYILFTSSAKMLCFCAYFPSLADSISSSSEIGEEGIHISSLITIPKSSIPPLFHNLTNLFSTQFIENGRMIKQANGILINTFDSLESESLRGLNEGTIANGLPPVIPVGPLTSCEFEKSLPIAWLDEQPEGEVVYISFGSRTAMSREQMQELGIGLIKSGCKFVWVVKDKKVDKEDEEGVEDILGNGLVEELKGKGLVIKSWVDQGEILSHRSVSGFVSHCGWNSVTEAAWYGVRMLAWPQGGDQKINAGVVRESGLGMWMEDWGWGGEKVVKEEEIGEMIRKLMGDEALRLHAAQVGEEARKAVGSSEASLLGIKERLQVHHHTI